MKAFLERNLRDNERQSDAYFQVIPVPLERTVSFGDGTSHAPAAIINASDQLGRVVINKEPCKRGVFTQYAVNCDSDLPTVLDELAKRTQSAAETGQIPVVLGGEHSVTYGAVEGITRAIKQPIGVIQIDAHADLHVDEHGQKITHATVMHLLAAKGVRIAQFGVRSLSESEKSSRLDNKIYYMDAEELVVGNITEVTLPDDFPEHVYISFDVDALDPSLMPATGTPAPGGLGYYQSLHIVASALGSRKIVGIDLVELAPKKGETVWDLTAAQIVYRLMALAV